MTTIFYDGEKAVNLFNNPDAWTIISGEQDTKGIQKLYSTVAYLYRCVSLRANAVAAMPFVLMKGKTEVAVWTGTDFEEDLPPKMEWLNNLNEFLAKTEAAACLMGGAYWERRKNVLGTRDLKYEWLLPSTIDEIYNGVPGVGGMKHEESVPLGELLGFWRREPFYGHREQTPGTIRELGIEDVVYFWLPDYGVEIGRAVNTPGRAVLTNAGVVSSMDIFLRGYFERGLVKAFIGKFAPSGNNTMMTPPSETEANRVKEFFRRVLFGVRNSANFEIVRSDFSIETIGEGVKDLRDNALSVEEKESIATGLGIPLSKLNSTSATDSNRNADEVDFIENTVIPEIGWIYQTLNEQIFYPMGMRIKAKPDTLRVMQEDETQRAAAFRQYVGDGGENNLTVEATIAILGIDIPDGVQVQPEPKPIPPMLQPFAGQDNPPQEQQQPEEEDDAIQKTAVTVLELLDKREEKKQYERWLRNRNYTAIKVDDFDSQYLTHDEKVEIAYKAIASTHKATRVDQLQTQYGDQLAAFVDNAIKQELSQQEFTAGMRDVVYNGLLAVFRESAAVPEGETLTEEENTAFSNILATELSRVNDFIGEIYTEVQNEEKATRFDRVRERLQGLAGNLGGRLSMWANAARMLWNQGMLYGRRVGDFRWGVGNTEKHCEDCLFYNGQVKSKEDWLKLGAILIYPQSRALACKGYECDCGYFEV